MAKEYTFQYELVQYKWPRWLQQQTEKQRTIWGYKILFLDVLFPLDVKKIIFVDADAVSTGYKMSLIVFLNSENLAARYFSIYRLTDMSRKDPVLPDRCAA